MTTQENRSPLTVQAIEAQNFFNLDHREVELPDQGLVLVTGTNGKGKSASTIEAVAWGLFGEIVRKPTVHSVVKRGQKSARVEIAVGGLKVTRSKAGVKSPTLQVEGEALYETTTKAQAALEQRLGLDYATWRRTHVVTSRDVDTFATSTDAQRKQYVEAVLGLDVFGEAHDRAKKARAEAGRLLAQAQTQQQVARAEFEAAQRHLESIRVISPDPGILPSLPEAQKRLTKAQTTLGEHDGLLRELRTLLRTKTELLDGLAGGTCPTCGQEVAAGEGLEDAVLEQLELQVRLQGAEEDRPGLAQAYSAALAEFQRVNQLHAQVAMHDRARLEVANAHQQVHERGEKLRSAVVNVNSAEKEFALCEHTERVLGNKGFRASALSKALVAASSLASHYLRRLEPEAAEGCIVLGSGDKEQLTLEVHGYPSESYGGCSDGQRRRVDLAVTLALSTMAPAKGTLFLDECLDRLDKEGVRCTLGFLQHLAEQRCVVLITHHDELIKSVERAAHIVC